MGKGDLVTQSQDPDNISKNNRRIAKNTLMLYLRMFFMTVISLYTSRVILQVLGVEDFGIYNVVGGVIALFGFLSNALSSASQRYIAHAIGEGNVDRQKLIFCTIMIVNVFLAIFIFIVGETIGLWFVHNQINVPAERFDAAIWVYHLSIISAMIGVVSTPYNGLVIAHERMDAFAYISILEAFLKLGMVFLLMFVTVDKLILYAVLYLCVFIIIRIIYTVYCGKRFEETHFSWQIDRPLLKELTSYVSWDLIGNFASTLAVQGVNILLNIFFGPVLNTARTISIQVQGLLQMFAGNFQSAVNPQIIKSYAKGDLSYMHSLIFRSGKLTFVLMGMLILPFIFETPYILDLWLGEYPDYAVPFVKLTLVVTLIDSMALPFMIAVRATGKIKFYCIVTGGLSLMLVPVSYIFLKLGADPTVVVLVQIVIASLCFVARLIIVKPLISFSVRAYVNDVLLKSAVVGILTLVPHFLLVKLGFNPHLEFFICLFLSVTLIIAFSYAILLDNVERNYIRQLVESKILRRI